MTQERKIAYRPLRKSEYEALYDLLLFYADEIKEQAVWHEENKDTARIVQQGSCWTRWKQVIDLVNEWGGKPTVGYPHIMKIGRLVPSGRHDSEKLDG